jgi:hypothetical protein
MTVGTAPAEADQGPVPQPRGPAPVIVAGRADVGVSAVRQASPRLRTQEDGCALAGEEQSIARLVESLVTAFPEVPEPHIRNCVEHIRATFANARIRIYIPILVARQARVVLARYSLPPAEGLRVG